VYLKFIGFRHLNTPPPPQFPVDLILPIAVVLSIKVYCSFGLCPDSSMTSRICQSDRGRMLLRRITVTTSVTMEEPDCSTWWCGADVGPATRRREDWPAELFIVISRCCVHPKIRFFERQKRMWTCAGPPPPPNAVTVITFSDGDVFL
jgi:hypothetical protein